MEEGMKQSSLIERGEGVCPKSGEGSCPSVIEEYLD